MPEKTKNYFEQLNIRTRYRHNLRQIVTGLSLVVILMVFWSLKLTGIGVAGEAFCGKQEHTHSDECLQRTLICTLEETQPHIHGESCLHRELVCQMEEGDSHTHEEACWSVASGFGCGQREADGHIHTAECLTGETRLDCGKEAVEGHTHTDACYEIVRNCRIEEHTHTKECYSDITADLETRDDWEKTFANMVKGPTPRENVVLVAQSQLGYRESTLNFQVDDQGNRRGITRYGQWYGNPYGDWSAMFASFCLHYAGVQDALTNAGPESMRVEWESAGLYETAGEGSPEIGNLVFLHKDDPASQGANAVAIITGFDETTVTVIEGDLDNTVAEARYQLDGWEIMGYGLVPEKNMRVVLAAPAPNCTIWLDGTDGGLDYLTGSPNTAYTAPQGSTFQLPDAWTSPSKYSYKLRGWYDVTNSRYYLPGGEMEVTGNAVLYADWVANTYNIGVFNAQVADTVSTNSFITTHMFDYNYLFNIHSSNAKVTVSANSHSEEWSMVTSGTVKHGDQQTLDFIFSDNDSSGGLNMPNNRSDRNRYHDATTVTSGIYSARLGDLLFSPYNAFDPQTGTGVLGKTYLGTGDHLFQLEDNPADENYGYYYYDSKRNAASYNQGSGRFYVYDYLAATSDSMGGAYSDFLPLNSPYANANGKTVGTYNYAGVDGEYGGVPHYRYDSKYNSGDYNSANNVYTDYAYGMRTNINFYLPNDPGTGGNKDLYGDDMQFRFSGDDDLWVLIDGVVALDIGGIHQTVSGSINFSTGEVLVNGSRRTSLTELGIGDGDHVLTVLYLERGASMSNCSIYFNLAPRFGMQLQKEDVLTQQMLDGAQFTVYEDYECTKPAELWESEDAYNQDIADGALDQFQSTFTVASGIARMWGLGSGNTYYIKETNSPAAEGYGIAEGVIRLTIEKDGQATYHADVLEDADGNHPSNGFTIHGVNIDEKTKTVYIVVTNAPETVDETTTVQVVKKWEDTADHSEDYIQAYLTVTDPDGTVRRIREITLSDENEWMYTWTNLPKHIYNTSTEVEYGIEESYESGYYSTVRRVTQIEISKTEWAEAASFVTGESYILGHSSGYLSTTSGSDTKLTWVDEATAKGSPLATWTAAVSNGKVKFTNGAGHILTFNNGNTNNNRYFHATTTTSNYQSFTPVDAGSGFRFYVTRTNRNYYMASLNTTNGRISSNTSSSSGMILTPMKRITQTDIQQVEDWAYQITNTPLGANNETALGVKKDWVIPDGYDSTMYQEYAVTVRLFANGANTGRSVTLNLKNGWQGSFLGLPYTDDNGNVIHYTVGEIWGKERWTTSYGQIQPSGGSPPTYSTVITNTYHPGGPELPSTGSADRGMYVLCGTGIVLGTLVYGIGSRRKRERRMK